MQSHINIKRSEAERNQAPHHAPAQDDAIIGDPRFRRLLGKDAWAALPAAVQHRFSHRLRDGAAITYVGKTIECRLSRLGYAVAHLCRLIGAPLPLRSDVGTAAIVTVTEDRLSGGQVWTRLYAHGHGVPQVIHSVKRFAGPTGLEEYLGHGIGIALRVAADVNAIHFFNDHYFLQVGSWRLRLPSWLGPGQMQVTHRDEGQGVFIFHLKLRHPIFGIMIAQTSRFCDIAVAKPRR